MPPARPASLKVRALQWLAQREHSRSELRDKLLHLLQRGHRGAERPDDAVAAGAAGAGGREPQALEAQALDSQVEVDALLDWLEQHGHLSDARFTESRVHARAARYGNRRIQQELRQHGVALEANAQQALVGSEFSRACAVWQRKYGAPADDAAGRLRQMRFLASRGFSIGVVQRVLKHGGSAAVDASAEGGG